MQRAAAFADLGYERLRNCACIESAWSFVCDRTQCAGKRGLAKNTPFAQRRALGKKIIRQRRLARDRLAIFLDGCSEGSRDDEPFGRDRNRRFKQ